jgi:exonuclease SbcC
LTLTKKKPKWALQAEIDAFESTEKIFKVVLIICCLQKMSFDQETMPLVEDNKKIVEQNKSNESNYTRWFTISI